MKKLISRDFKTFYMVNEFVAKTTPMRTHYNSLNPVERWLWQKKKQVIHDMLHDISYENVIDVGCGDGGLLEVVKSNSAYTGVDISPTQLASFRKELKKNKRKRVHLVRSDITKLPFPDHHFDLALACDVLEHVLNPERVFREIHRIVKKDGFIIFSIPNEKLLQVSRLITLRFPIRSPDHLQAIEVNDMRKYFPSVISYFGIPIPFSSRLSLINILLVQNDMYD